jgi:F-type H+-transporting ATPase subunit b
MLKIDWTFFVQVINFLVLLILLNYILFKPLLCILTRRDDHIKGSINSAKALGIEKETHLQEVEKSLKEAREKAKTLFEGLTKEGLAVQKASVEKAHKYASGLTEKARKELEIEAKKAKEALRKEVESFSKMIVEKMVRV